MNKIHYAVLYTSFLLFANALSANEANFGDLNSKKVGDMKKMTLATHTFNAPNTVFFSEDEKFSEDNLRQKSRNAPSLTGTPLNSPPCRR